MFALSHLLCFIVYSYLIMSPYGLVDLAYSIKNPVSWGQSDSTVIRCLPCMRPPQD